MASTDPAPGQPRPRQVTLAASLVMGASLLLVLSVFERLGQLRSLESRTAVQRFLSEPPGSDLGIGLESALQALRTVSMVAAGLATAAAILGYHVLKRNRSARIALSVLAVPLFLCGMVTGGFLASVVAASAAMLWLAPARTWFSGRPAPERPAAGTGTTARVAAPPPPPTRQQPGPTAPSAAPSPAPPPTQSSAPVSGSAVQPPPWPSYAAGPPWPAPPHAAPAAARARSERPTGITVACAVTWVCCALGVIMSLLVLGVMAADADGLFAEMHRQNPNLGDQGVSDATLRTATWVTSALCLVWCAVAGGLAVLVFNRRRWAAIGLLASAGLVAVVCLAASLVSPVLVLPGVLAAGTAGLLLQPTAQRWLAGRGTEHAGT